MVQNVVELSQYRDRDHFPALRCLGNYWHNLANSSVPYRADLDPRGLQDALSHIVLLERILGEMHVCAFAGDICVTSCTKMVADCPTL